MKYEFTNVSTTLSMVMHLRTLCAVLTNTSLFACSNPCKSSAPCGHGMAPKRGQGHDRLTFQVKQVFQSWCLKVENFGKTKLSGLGRCGLTFILSNSVQLCWKTALRFSAVSKSLLSYCGSERRNFVKKLLNIYFHDSD